MTDTLPVPTRDQVRDGYLRDYALAASRFNLTADTASGTQPFIDASVLADQMTGIYAGVIKAGNNTLVRTSFGKQLDLLGDSQNVPRRPAVGSTGFVTVTTSTGGGTIFAGDEIRSSGGLRFQATRTAVYATGDTVPVQGLDTGPSTNLAAGAVMTWTSPRPGISPTAVVFEQQSGAGLEGGADIEADGSYQDRIIAARSTRPASGNDAEYIEAVEGTPGVPIEKAFAYSAVLGPGSIAVAFTVRADAPGVSRRSSGAQEGVVDARLRSLFPGDDMIFVLHLLADAVTIALRVSWATEAEGWVDATPWPPYYAPTASGTPGAVIVDGSVTPTATSFKLKTSNVTYTAVAQPAVGDTIAFYDPSSEAFIQKRIGSFTGTGPWVITCDATFAASDASFVPVAGQRVSPWSPSLDAVAVPVATYVDGMGPGEQLAAFLDPSLRQKRVPSSPKAWPSVVDNRALTGALEVPEVADASAVEGIGHQAPVGTAGATAYLTELGDLAVFPLA